MSFADELRTQQQIQQATRRYSDEDVYQNILINSFEELKMHIKGSISNRSTNILSGEDYLNYYAKCTLDPKLIDNRESVYHIITPGEYGAEIYSKRLCETIIKHGFIAASAKAVFTQMGQRLTNDLIIMAQNEGIKIWFTPEFSSPYGKQKLSKFDEYEKVGTSGACEVIIHYEIKI